MTAHFAQSGGFYHSVFETKSALDLRLSWAIP